MEHHAGFVGAMGLAPGAVACEEMHSPAPETFEAPARRHC